MKTNTWQIQEAKNHFSEVVSRACELGVQTITKHGKPVAVVVAVSEFQSRPKASAKKKPSLFEFLQSCPCPEIATHIERGRRPRTTAEPSIFAGDVREPSCVFCWTRTW